MPSQSEFQKNARKLGINTSSQIVVYDDKGVYTSPRVWWLFKYFGFDNVAVLDGGLPGYLTTGKSTQVGHTVPTNNGDIVAIAQPDLIVSYEDIRCNITSRKSCHIDVRSAGRFSGVDPEPRKILQSGSIEHSQNLPYTEVLQEGFFKSREELVTLFQTKEIFRGTPQIFSCGSGITACIVLLAYAIAYEELGPIYDGSWTEWAMKNELFV